MCTNCSLGMRRVLFPRRVLLDPYPGLYPLCLPVPTAHLRPASQLQPAPLLTPGISTGLLVARLHLHGISGAHLPAVLGRGVGTGPGAAPHAAPAFGVTVRPFAPGGPGPVHWVGKKQAEAVLVKTEELPSRLSAPSSEKQPPTSTGVVLLPNRPP